MRESSLPSWALRGRANRRCSIASRRSTPRPQGRFASLAATSRKCTGESSRNSAATNSALYFKTRICSTPSPCARISRSRSRFKRNRRAKYLPWSTKWRRGWALERSWSNIPTKSRAAKNSAPPQRARSSRSQASFWPMNPQARSTQNRPNSCSKRFQRSTEWARRSSW